MSAKTRFRLVALPPRSDVESFQAAVVEQEFQGGAWRTRRAVPLSINPELPDYCRAQPAEFGATVGAFFERALRALADEVSE